MRMLLSAAALCALFCFCACSTVPERESSMSGEFLNAIRNLQGRKELAGMPLFHWTSSTDCKILFISDHRVSFQIEKSVYTGGAHGMTCTRVGTFQDGVLLKLADLPEQENFYGNRRSPAISRRGFCGVFPEVYGLQAVHDRKFLFGRLRNPFHLQSV